MALGVVEPNANEGPGSAGDAGPLLPKLNPVLEAGGPEFVAPPNENDPGVADGVVAGAVPKEKDDVDAGAGAGCVVEPNVDAGLESDGLPKEKEVLFDAVVALGAADSPKENPVVVEAGGVVVVDEVVPKENPEDEAPSAGLSLGPPKEKPPDEVSRAGLSLGAPKKLPVEAPRAGLSLGAPSDGLSLGAPNWKPPAAAPSAGLSFGAPKENPVDAEAVVTAGGAAEEVPNENDFGATASSFLSAGAVGAPKENCLAAGFSASGLGGAPKENGLAEGCWASDVAPIGLAVCVSASAVAGVPKENDLAAAGAAGAGAAAVGGPKENGFETGVSAGLSAAFSTEAADGPNENDLPAVLAGAGVGRDAGVDDFSTALPSSVGVGVLNENVEAGFSEDLSVAFSNGAEVEAVDTGEAAVSLLSGDGATGAVPFVPKLKGAGDGDADFSGVAVLNRLGAAPACGGVAAAGVSCVSSSLSYPSLARISA